VTHYLIHLTYFLCHETDFLRFLGTSSLMTYLLKLVPLSWKSLNFHSFGCLVLQRTKKMKLMLIHRKNEEERKRSESKIGQDFIKKTERKSGDGRRRNTGNTEKEVTEVGKKSIRHCQEWNITYLKPD